MTDLVLSAAEVEALTGYKRSGDQLRELHRLGFFRARPSKVTRQVILERAHYHAVCAGSPPANQEQFRPVVKPPTLRAVK